MGDVVQCDCGRFYMNRDAVEESSLERHSQNECWRWIRIHARLKRAPFIPYRESEATTVRYVSGAGGSSSG